MKFVLCTDTSCDLPKTELIKNNIHYVPLTYTIDSNIYEDELSLDSEYKLFYDKLRAGAMPTTSQINPTSHELFFTKLIENGAREILHLSLSGGLSATYNSAVIGAENAKQKFPKAEIYVVDTLSATQAHNYLLKKALDMQRAGKTSLETSIALNYIKNNLHAWILPDDLMHLKRGGRVGTVSAVIGTVLNIKPVLIINKMGGLSLVNKVKGTKKGLDFFCDKLIKYGSDYKNQDIWIAHADCMESAQALYGLLRQKGCKGNIIIGWIGPVIGAHTGAGTIGIVFEGQERIK